MKTSHKNYLKSLLLTSVASIGGTQASIAAPAPIVAISKDEMTRDNSINETLTSTLSSSILSPGTTFSEIAGHTSHSSHSSHSSHKSHTSSSGYGYGGGSSYSSGGSSKSATIACGAILGGYALYYIIHKIVKSHKKRKANKALKMDQEYATYSRYNYGTRELSPNTYGADLNTMIDYLIDNNVLKKNDIKYTKNHHFYKYNSNVKKSVKKMQRRMGLPMTGIATVKFQTNLKQWKKLREQYNDLIKADTININDNQEALTAVAILLIEKGFLKEYDVDNVTTPIYKNLILDAYHDFLKKQKLPISDDINLEILNLLHSLPSKQ